MRKYFTVRRLRMADFMSKKGIYPVETVPNIYNPRYNVWKYRWDSKFEAARQEYFELVKQPREING